MTTLARQVMETLVARDGGEPDSSALIRVVHAMSPAGGKLSPI